jgi:histidinol phosphatase-like enzyme
MTSVAALRLPDSPTIVDASHVQHAKPEPDLLLYGARELGVDPAACWYVGDSTGTSPRRSRRACCRSRSPPGRRCRQALTGAGAALVVATLEDVVAALPA